MKIIIANTDVAALFKATDAILARTGKEYVPENIKGQVALSVLKNMMEKDYFDVCRVDSLAKMNEVTISAEHRQLYGSMHCIYWNQMHPETRDYIMATLVDYFRGNISMANSHL